MRLILQNRPKTYVTSCHCRQRRGAAPQCDRNVTFLGHVTCSEMILSTTMKMMMMMGRRRCNMPPISRYCADMLRLARNVLARRLLSTLLPAAKQFALNRRLVACRQPSQLIGILQEQAQFNAQLNHLNNVNLCTTFHRLAKLSIPSWKIVPADLRSALVERLTECKCNILNFYFLALLNHAQLNRGIYQIYYGLFVIYKTLYLIMKALKSGYLNDL
jgi:hypothetical protein